MSYARCALGLLVLSACGGARHEVVNVTQPVADPYADLLPLEKAIGDARVVALGEPSHAEGNMFATQARLVRFLHERMGFDVLAWEAGLWSCETDAARCVGFPWGTSVETRSVRPPPAGVHVTGFDFQLSGPARESSLANLRDRLVERAGTGSPLAERLVTACGRFPKMKSFQPLTIAQRDSDRQAFRDVLARIDGSSASRDERLLHRAVENVIGLYDWHESVRADLTTHLDSRHNAQNSVRDRAMADNVLWLMTALYPGEKIILWLATFHAARSLNGLTDPKGELDLSDGGAFRPMGSWLSDALGSAYFALGMTAYEGRIGNPPNAQDEVIEPASPGSIDAEWAPAREELRFVPRSALAREETLARFIGLAYFRGRWDRVLDGGLVFRTVTPVTQEPRVN